MLPYNSPKKCPDTLGLSHDTVIYVHQLVSHDTYDIGNAYPVVGKETERKEMMVCQKGVEFTT